MIIGVGYPGDWRRWTPQVLRTEHEAVIAKLLAGDIGSKRLAAEARAGMLACAPGNAPWTVIHDLGSVLRSALAAHGVAL